MAKILDSKILDSLIRQVSKGDQGARIGYFDDSGKHPRSKYNAYEIAAINNHGDASLKIPKRPFVTDGAYEGEARTESILRDSIRKIHKGQLTYKKAIRVAAQSQEEFITAQLIMAPWSGMYADNAQSTIASKGTNSPLFETGWLQKQIDIKYD